MRSFWFITALVLAILGPANPSRGDPVPPRSLYVTNGGTSDISVFRVGGDGTVAALGDPVRTGRMPRGIVLAPDGRAAYVANSGTSTITAYTIGPDGGLTRPAQVKTGETPFGLAVAPNGRTLYAADHDANTVSVFRIRADRTLARLGDPVPSRADTPNGVIVSPDGRFLYLSAGVPLAGNKGSLVTFAIRSNGTLASHGEPMTLESAGEGMVISPNARLLYLTATPSEHLYGFRIGSDGGLTEVPGSPVVAPSRPIGPVVTPDGRHLYVTVGEFGTQPQGIRGYTIAADGSLSPLAPDPFEAGGDPSWASVDAEGRHLYVVNRTSNDVTVHRIRPDGTLDKIASTPTGGTGALFQSVAISR